MFRYVNTTTQITPRMYRNHCNLRCCCLHQHRKSVFSWHTMQSEITTWLKSVIPTIKILFVFSLPDSNVRNTTKIRIYQTVIIQFIALHRRNGSSQTLSLLKMHELSAFSKAHSTNVCFPAPPTVRIIAIDKKYFENHQNQNWELEAENLHKVPQDECEKRTILEKF